MVKQAALEGALASILGNENVLPPERAGEFAVDGLAPKAVAAPQTVEQVAEVSRYAHREGLAIIPWGGGTMMHIGNIPRRYDIALSLSRLDRVVEHEPADLTAAVQAGIALNAFQRHLEKAGQLVPLGPPLRQAQGRPWGEKATIGGILAVNASGPSRHAYGTPRDFTIGLRVVTADGRITKAGGRVVKNVAGYDLCKLYIGSLGTLGVIVEATFKLAPLPKTERTVIAFFETAEQARAFAADLHHRGLSLRALQLLNPAAASVVRLPQDRPYPLVLDLAGSFQAVERSHWEIGDLTQGAAIDALEVADSERLRESVRQLASPTDYPLVCKVSALPTHLPTLIEALEAGSEPPYIVAWPTIGVMHASWPSISDAESLASRLSALTSEMGGTLVVEACPLEIKRRIDVFGEARPDFDLMRRVKEQLDPTAILNPGRYLGRL